MLTRNEMHARIPDGHAHYDVLVAGGGPAGLGAAAAAARTGAKTLVLEESSFFGGVAAVAMWMPVNRLMLEGGPRGGVHDRFVEKIRSYGTDASIPGSVSTLNGDGLNIHPDYLRLACFELLEEAGCHYRLYSPVTDVLKSGSAVTGVKSRHKGIEDCFNATVTIDATGDGDVAFLAGAEMAEGREEDGVHMPVSLVFAVMNVDVEVLYEFFRKDYGRFEAILDEAAADGYAVAAWYSFDQTSLPGVVNVNNGAWREQGSINACKASELTVAERAGIRVAVDFVEFARKKGIPGLNDCRLMHVGARAGVRDTRRLLGQYVQTVEDARAGAEFDDLIARKYGSIDANQLFIGEMHSGFAYPYRCLLPESIENLLVAGRCGSATFLGHASGKSMGNMMAIGQAAGVAAALCCRDSVPPHRLDVSLLQGALRDMGVRL